MELPTAFTPVSPCALKKLVTASAKACSETGPCNGGDWPKPGRSTAIRVRCDDSASKIGAHDPLEPPKP